MSENNILINNKSEILNLNTKERIILNWSNLNQEQKSFRIVVSNEGEPVFDTEVIESKEPFFEISMPHSVERKSYHMMLEIISSTNEPMSFEKTFYSNNENLKKANWITRLDNPLEKEFHYFNDKPNMIFEKEFDYDGSNGNIFLDICGLGYYTVKINGQKIDDTFLNSDVSNYSKTVYFDTYEIKEFLKQGKNTISVELANGWYNPAPIKLLGKYNVRSRMPIGKPCLICQINFVDKNNKLITINSDESWQSKNGNYLFNNLFIGERVVSSADLIENQGMVKNQTVKIIGPSGELVPSQIRKIKRTGKFYPQKIQKVGNDILIDFGRVISGHFACKLSANVEGEITFFYSEAIDEDNNLEYESCISGVYGYSVKDMGIDEKDPVIQYDEITKDKTEFHFENQYTYHSFRYVLVKHDGIQVEDLQDICAHSVHTDLEFASHFESSNEQFNLLWRAARDTKLNNIHSIFEDCPRERLGYGGDIVTLIDSQIYSFDVEQLLKKVFKDFVNDQTGEGGIPQTAPYIGIQTNGPSDRAGSLGWQLVLPTIAKKIKKHYFQPHFVEDNRDALMKHVNYLLAFDYDYIKHCCLADWGSIDTEFMTTPDREFCSAMMYYLLLTTYAELFEDEEEIKEKASEVAAKIIDEFYNEEGYFQSGSQSSYAFALTCGILNGEKQELVLKNFINKIESDNGILRGGIFGIPWTYKILSEAGRDDIVYKWLNRKEYPSFFDMLSKGGEILREHFDAKLGSYNHAMFTSYPTWMVEKILGLQITDHAEGANKLKIAPFFPEEMSYAQGSVDTVRGTISTHWERVDGAIQMTVKIPKGIEFELQLNEEYQLVNKTILDDSVYNQIELNIKWKES